MAKKKETTEATAVEAVKVAKRSFKLPKKRIKVMPNKKPTAFIPDTSHVASFLMDRAKIVLVVPMQRNGQLKNPLTNEEKEFFEDRVRSGLSFEPGDLSVYKKQDNFWMTYEVALDKNVKTLDLSNPMDYLQYKVLLLNTDLVAHSSTDRNHKATYKYYLIDEEAESVGEAALADVEERAWTEFGKLKLSRKAMADFLRVTGKTVTAETTDAQLVAQIRKYIKEPNGPANFLNIVNDKHYNLRILLKEAVYAGVLNFKAKKYYTADTQELLGTLPEAISYLADPMNQDVYLTIKQRVETANE